MIDAGKNQIDFKHLSADVYAIGRDAVYRIGFKSLEGRFLDPEGVSHGEAVAAGAAFPVGPYDDDLS